MSKFDPQKRQGNYFSKIDGLSNKNPWGIWGPWTNPLLITPALREYTKIINMKITQYSKSAITQRKEIRTQKSSNHS